MTNETKALKPTLGDPHTVRYEDGNPLPAFIHWAVSFGFALNIGVLDPADPSTLAIDAHFSDAEQAAGHARGKVTSEQLVSFARQLLDVAETDLVETRLRARGGPVSRPVTWCSWTHKPVGECAEHASGHPHQDVPSELGAADEPQVSGALVLAWPGDYRYQQVWVGSGANIGNWYCLGNEFGRPHAWDAPKRDVWERGPVPKRSAGTVPSQPAWEDVLRSGPVVLLTFGWQSAYRQGWRNGRRDLASAIESLAEDDSGSDRVPEQ